jgi:hypothetical protein
MSPWYRDGQEIECDVRLGDTGDDGCWRVALDALTDSLYDEWGVPVFDDGRASWNREFDEEYEGIMIWEGDDDEG